MEKEVVDDFLIVSSSDDVEKFSTAISARFTVGRCIRDQMVIFNGIRINRYQIGSVTYDMVEYLYSIKPIEICR